MSCNKVHGYLESNPRLDASLPPELLQHAAACSDCARVADLHVGLGKSLVAIRESVPFIPEALDARVLAHYRDQASTGQSSTRLKIGGLLSSSAFRWTLAAAASLAIIALLVVSARKATPIAVHNTPPQPAVVTETATTPATTAPTIAASPEPKQPRRRRQRPAVDRSAIAANRFDNRLPDGFRSLMYCDELACSEPMNVIRVQIPSSLVSRPAAGFMPVSDSVNADVLVGPDGIARGIRIVDF